MFDFLKKLFKQEEEEIIEKIKKDELDKWFQEKVKEFDESVKKQWTSLKNELSDILKNTHEALVNLEKAELRNSNISVREKQFMEGNRKAYLFKTGHFLKEIEGILEHEVAFFLNRYKEYLENFTKSTSRAYTILQEFLAHESREVALKIKDIDMIVEKIKKDEKVHSHVKIEKIRKDFAAIENKVLKKKELTKELSHLKEKIANLKKDEEELISRKSKLESSSEYKAFLGFKEKVKKKEEDVKTIKSKFYSDFSSLERPLRKYQRVAFQHDKLIEHYSVDPLNALLTDFSLKIVEIFKGLSKNIEEGKITLKDKKSGKVLSMIDDMDERYFTVFLRDYNNSIKEKEELDKEIKENKVKKDLVEILEMLEKTKSKEKEAKARLHSAKEELEGIDISKLQYKIKGELEDIFGIGLEFC